MIPNDGAMTNEKCTRFCGERGFAYAGTQYARWCFCGDSHADRGASDNCTMECSGDPGEICGGGWANSVYRASGAGDVVTTTAAPEPIAAPAPAVPQTAPGAYLGCFADNPGAQTNGLGNRVLGGAMIPSDGAMTNDKCTRFCGEKGFAYAGTQYARWCFCGDSHADRGTSDNCTMNCSGDPGEICGGGWANSVYRAK